jgi:hypothetical protein
MFERKELTRFAKFAVFLFGLTLVASLASEVYTIYLTKKLDLVEYNERYIDCETRHRSKDLYREMCRAAEIELSKYILIESITEAVLDTVAFKFSIVSIGFVARLAAFLMEGLSIVTIIAIGLVIIFYFQFGTNKSHTPIYLPTTMWKIPDYEMSDEKTSPYHGTLISENRKKKTH